MFCSSANFRRFHFHHAGGLLRMWEEFVQDFKDVEFGKDLLDHAEPVNLPGFLFDDEVE